VTESPGPAKQGALWSAIRWLSRQLFPVWVIVWINGLVLRLTVRDSVEFLAPLYYATPWPVLALLTLPFVAVVWRSPKMVLGVLVVVHLFGAAWILESWRTNEPAKGAADLRLVQWNVSRPWRRLPGTLDRVRNFDADIIMIAEPMPERWDLTPDEWDETEKKWLNAFPGYETSFSSGNMLAAVRGTVVSTQSDELDKGSWYTLRELQIKGRSCRLLQLDIFAKPTNPRRPPLTALVELANSLRDQPLVIVGDFNTPRDSAFIDPLRKHHHNAWEVAGIRGADTWPWPLPVLSLDQVWANDLIKPLRCRTAGNWRSDHLWVEAEFVFTPDTRN